MSAEEEVRQASEQYYAALTGLLNGDAGPLMQIWSHSPDATAMNHTVVGKLAGSSSDLSLSGSHNCA